MELKIFYVEAFSDKIFGGNTAAVVIDDAQLSTHQMQKIACQLKLSETAFVKIDTNEKNNFIVRFFTPLQEVDLCGHATIATFEVLYKNGYIDIEGRNANCSQITKAGKFEVQIEIEDENTSKIVMLQGDPRIVNKNIDTDKLCSILGIDIKDIGIDGFHLTPQVVTTGLEDIIFPVKKLEVLKEIKPNMNKLADVCRELDIIGIHCFTTETLDSGAHAHCRNFAPLVGINEEAATGTSSGALAYYLIENNIYPLSNSRSFTFEQGFVMNRPSRIHATIIKDHLHKKIYVGGQAKIFISGVLSL
ncbi:PhzF family phenazine biosynthesis protein [Alkaliphilus peptidifermentans]|uniref:Phenazine biosynthesis protein PhzF family n=1 Tax=Alkaliphilus peptidifermentans DSM 18978 TaxID=1120976 RepID=A0A1G5HG51_9FIRM|nr:PhzF family phenazine biosynthesis protein [Alkaliphilus peptidifermentans]SCY62694.1 phenazine biosynthesis protein PhzF family [Alkaliphilus peptidifermentans DSM 18978]